MISDKTLTNFLAKTDWPDQVSAKPLTLDEPFIDFAARFTHLPGTVVLLSGGNLDSAEHHILALHPWLTFSAKAQTVTLKTDDSQTTLTADPFAVQKEVVAAGKKALGTLPLNPPVTSGLFGYWGYDLKDHTENLPKTSVDDLLLPDLLLYAPTLVIVQEAQTGQTTLFHHHKGEPNSQILDQFHRLASAPAPPQGHFSGDTFSLKANFTRPAYQRAVDRIKNYIRAGDVYQVNLSQRFDTHFSGDPFALFQHLYNQNPAPFFAYMNGEDHQIISTSPERYLKLDGSKVETRPIKGTHPRFDDPEKDRESKTALEVCPKNDAELSMIVDLLRNDIGKVCQANTVEVTTHKKVETYQNVYHLVSIINGILEDDCDATDLMQATFPGGSITGCPKVRAMEIIDELESSRRHIYTGAIGYVSFHDTLDLSIAIRTATVVEDHIYFSVGGGIVYDSDPSSEYEETLHKGHTIMRAVKGADQQDDVRERVWLSGKLVPAAHAAVPAMSTGFQYGEGLFETIRVVNGKVCFLDEHLQRLRQSWETLFENPWPDLGWETIIDQVVRSNRLKEQVAVVKLLAAKGKENPPHARMSLLVTAKLYQHRLEQLQVPGLAVGVYPHPRQTPLADHKTTNYLYYFQAGKWAKANGFHEAIILNSDGSVSETNTANLLLIEGKTIVTPASKHVLPGIMQQQVCQWLEKSGYSVKSQPMTVEDLLAADAVWLTNSLMGVVPVVTIDGQSVGENPLWRQINADLL